MQGNRARDTKPELAVRRLLHRQGFRYRVAIAPEPHLRRRADIVFTRARVAVFIDGCFWHGCPQHGRTSFQHNPDYWPTKIATNAARDQDTNAKLRAAGWAVLRFWEHEDPDDVVRAITHVLQSNPVLHRREVGEEPEVRVREGADNQPTIEESIELLTASLR